MSEVPERGLTIGERVRFRKADDPVRVQAEKEMRLLYDAGASILKVSDKAGLSYWTVRQGLIRAGTRFRRHEPAPYQQSRG